MKYQRSEFPTFSNVLLHVNGATLEGLEEEVAKLCFDEQDKTLDFSVIDGQHRINGAYFAVDLLREKDPAQSGKSLQRSLSTWTSVERHPDTRPRSSLMSISIRRRLTVPLWRTCSQPRGAARTRRQGKGRTWGGGSCSILGP